MRRRSEKLYSSRLDVQSATSALETPGRNTEKISRAPLQHVYRGYQITSSRAFAIERVVSG